MQICKSTTSLNIAIKIVQYARGGENPITTKYRQTSGWCLATDVQFGQEIKFFVENVVDMGYRYNLLGTNSPIR